MPRPSDTRNIVSKCSGYVFQDKFYLILITFNVFKKFELFLVIKLASWGGSRGGSVEPTKVQKKQIFDHTFSYEKRTC